MLLAAYIEDAEGKIVDVDGNHYAVNARLREGCEVVSFQLQLLQEDEVVYETPSIAVRVIENDD